MDLLTKNEPAEHIENQRPEWFAAWLPRPPIPLHPAKPTRPPETVMEAEAAPEMSTAIDQVREELKLVTGHLLDPSAAAVKASLPHLERAVKLFSGYVKMKELPSLEPALDSLRAELALATMLFENAYALQAGWAAQVGLNLDGTPKQLLYSRPASNQALAAVIHQSETSWEG